jgi:hypothetical protein
VLLAAGGAAALGSGKRPVRAEEKRGSRVTTDDVDVVLELQRPVVVEGLLTEG